MRKYLEAEWYRFERTCIPLWLVLCLFALSPVMFMSIQQMAADAFSGVLQLVTWASLPFVVGFYSMMLHDGTVRNRLISGASRAAIYLSSLLLGIGIGLSFLTVTTVALGLRELGFNGWLPGYGYGQNLGAFLLVSFTDSAMCITTLVCLAHMVTTFTRSRLSALIACAIALLAVALLSGYVVSVLDEPAFLFETVENLDGTFTSVYRGPNPGYLMGNARIFVQFWENALPFVPLFGRSQTWEPSGICWLYWGIESVLFSAVGCAVMRKKDFS